MSESGDYDPGPWTGYDFNSARSAYDVHVGRSYVDAVKASVKAENLIPESIETQSESPVVVAIDVTGSMGDWPKTIFSKLPYLDLEGKEYLGTDMEISFAGVGDMFSDNYPLQIQPFCSGKDMEDALKKLIIEGNGGGQYMESYDLPALYYSRNVSMPNAIRPIFIFIGDEGLYDFVDRTGAKDCAKVDINKRISVKEIIDELKTKFAVYLVRKPYSRSSSNEYSTLDEKIQKQWEDLLGEDHICLLPDPNRVVDVIFGIFAKETGKNDYFKDEITARQKEDQVKVVMKSLMTINRPAKSKKSINKSQSITHSKSSGKPTKSLLD